MPRIIRMLPTSMVVSLVLTTATVYAQPPEIQLIDLGEVQPLGPIMLSFMATGGNGELVWSDLSLTEGSPAIAATLAADGTFSWDPTGSPFGSSGNGVLYAWSASVIDEENLSDTGVALQYSLVPEPAALTNLGFGLAITFLVGFGHRGRKRLPGS